MKKITEFHVHTMLNRMLSIHNLTVDDVRDVPDWFQKYTMTEAQRQEWKTWCVDYMRRELKFPKYVAEREVRWMDFQWGLKVENDDQQ